MEHCEIIECRPEESSGLNWGDDKAADLWDRKSNGEATTR